MRRLVPFLCLVAAGCGSLVPHSLAPDWLAPDVVPEPDRSSIVVLDHQAGAAGVVRGRVLDVGTGRPIAGAVVRVVGDGEDTRASTPGGFFSVPGASGDLRLHVEAGGYVPAEGSVPAGASVLVLLHPIPTPPAEATTEDG